MPPGCKTESGCVTFVPAESGMAALQIEERGSCVWFEGFRAGVARARRGARVGTRGIRAGRIRGSGRRAVGSRLLHAAGGVTVGQRGRTDPLQTGERQPQGAAAGQQSVDGDVPVKRPARAARLRDRDGDRAEREMDRERQPSRRHRRHRHAGHRAAVRPLQADDHRQRVRRRRNRRVAESGLRGRRDRLPGLHDRRDPHLHGRALGGPGSARHRPRGQAAAGRRAHRSRTRRTHGATRRAARPSAGPASCSRATRRT